MEEQLIEILLLTQTLHHQLLAVIQIQQFIMIYRTHEGRSLTFIKVRV